MKIHSIFVGGVREVAWGDRRVETGIFKEPIDHPIRVKRLNLVGDAQADLRVHGGEHKAVYSYTAEAYDEWRRELAPHAVPYGIFGENLTIEGMNESQVFVGDHFAIGSVILEATQPRMPCYKLGIRFGDAGIIPRFMKSGRWGIYYRVVQEGLLAPRDPVKKVYEHPARVPVHTLLALAKGEIENPEHVRALLQLPTLTPSIREKLESITT